jgi:hypothetical protein
MLNAPSTAIPGLCRRTIPGASCGSPDCRGGGTGAGSVAFQAAGRLEKGVINMVPRGRAPVSGLTGECAAVPFARRPGDSPYGKAPFAAEPAPDTPQTAFRGSTQLGHQLIGQPHSNGHHPLRDHSSHFAYPCEPGHRPQIARRLTYKRMTRKCYISAYLKPSHSR